MYRCDNLNKRGLPESIRVNKPECSDGHLSNLPFTPDQRDNLVKQVSRIECGLDTPTQSLQNNSIGKQKQNFPTLNHTHNAI